MADIISFEDGESLDLDTIEGAYQYVGRFLNKHAAHSSEWACLAKLYRRARGTEASPAIESGEKIIVDGDKAIKIIAAYEDIRPPFTPDEQAKIDRGIKWLQEPDLGEEP